MSMDIEVGEGNYKFLDSHCFMPTKLASLSKMFDLPDQKGYFPFRMNTEANRNYDGPFPTLDNFEPELLNAADKKKLEAWHATECTRYNADPSMSYNLHDEMVKYCIMDVTVLRQACQSFQRLFEEVTGVDPFESCITLPSTCHKAFRVNWLEPNTIGVIPALNYREHRRDSIMAQQWIAWQASKDGKTYQHARSDNGEKKIGRYFVDGYDAASKTILQFYGSYYHGDPEVYSPITFNQLQQCTMGELYAQTLDREEYLRSLGYTVITMWESKYKQLLAANATMQQFVDGLNLAVPLQPRDAFAGGRTNTLQLYSKCSAEEMIIYVDVTSLYPYINKTGKLPTGHPQIIVGEDYVPGQHCGLVKCKILPPVDLYHPLLWHKSDGKLLFPLCQTCADARQQDLCEHDEEQRALDGTWVTPEIDKALDLGYKILRTHEIWHFATSAQETETTKGLFTPYINTFMKLKTEASGYPAWVGDSEESKAKYVDAYYAKEKIRLDTNKIALNPGMRTLAKFAANSFWGKFGQRPNLSKTEYVTSAERWYHLLQSDAVTIHHVHIVNSETLLVSHSSTDMFVEDNGTTNLVLAAFTTALARLHLYSLFEVVGETGPAADEQLPIILYSDTDSLIIKCSKTCNPMQAHIADYLGMLTDELAEYGAGVYITEFVSGAPKNYGYRLSNGATVWKVKGITQSFRTSQLLSFEVMLEMILDSVSRNGKKVEIPENLIARNKITTQLVDVHRFKTYRFCYDKNVLLPNYKTVPFGYRFKTDNRP